MEKDSQEKAEKQQFTFSNSEVHSKPLVRFYLLPANVHFDSKSEMEGFLYALIAIRRDAFFRESGSNRRYLRQALLEKGNFC